MYVMECMRAAVSTRQAHMPDGSVVVSVDAALRGAGTAENGTLVASFTNDTAGWNASAPVQLSSTSSDMAVTLQVQPEGPTSLQNRGLGGTQLVVRANLTDVL